MGNVTIIILTVVLVVLFLFFLIGSAAEFKRMGNEKYDPNDKGGVVSLKEFLGKFLGD